MAPCTERRLTDRERHGDEEPASANKPTAKKAGKKNQTAGVTVHVLPGPRDCFDHDPAGGCAPYSILIDFGVARTPSANVA
jgi:hypothetical protein